MYPALNHDEADMQQHRDMQQRAARDHEEIPLHNNFNRSVSETPERVRVRQIFNRVSPRAPTT